MTSTISSARLPRVWKSCCINSNSSLDQPTPMAGMMRLSEMMAAVLMALATRKGLRMGSTKILLVNLRRLVMVDKAPAIT